MKWQVFVILTLRRMSKVIVSAIRDRRVLAIHAGQTERKVEPHAFGLDYAGKAILLCYDVSAPAVEGRRGWALLTVNQCTQITPQDECFSRARMGYRRDDTGLCSVVEQV